MNWITKFIKPGLKTLLKKRPKNEEESLWTTCNCQQLIYKEDLYNNFFHSSLRCGWRQKLNKANRFYFALFCKN